MTMLLVNLPVTDLERAKAFYGAIGFPINPAFMDHNAACVRGLSREGWLARRTLPSHAAAAPNADPAMTVRSCPIQRRALDWIATLRRCGGGGYGPRP
jgi:hypothetical protein